MVFGPEDGLAGCDYESGVGQHFVEQWIKIIWQARGLVEQVPDLKCIGVIDAFINVEPPGEFAVEVPDDGIVKTNKPFIVKNGRNRRRKEFADTGHVVGVVGVGRTVLAWTRSQI